jgi:dolichyl-phosphate-mannose-protein mannosyltransferase
MKDSAGQLLKRYAGPLLLAILAFAFFTRTYNLHQPTNYVFDEVYHGLTAKLIARNDPQAFEWWNPPVEPNTAVDWLHPPLAKYSQALMILAFGENSFGWRLSSVIVGVLVILLTAKLGYLLFRNIAISLLAALLAAFDGLLLVQSRIAMNDIHITLIMLILLAVYWKAKSASAAIKPASHLSWQWLLALGVLGGLAISTKWSGLFALSVVWFYELLQLLKQLLSAKKYDFSLALETGKWLVLRLSLLVVLPALVYVLSYGQMFAQGKDFAHFRELHQQIWWYQTNLNATHPYQSRPWEWFLNLRPVWYHVDYVSDTQRANIYAFGNPLLFWLGGISIFASIIWVGRQKLSLWLQPSGRSLALKKRLLSLLSLADSSLAFALLSYLVVWLPWQLSPRIMFFYHYTPAVPLMSIILAYWLYQLWNLPKAKTARKLPGSALQFLPLLAPASVVLIGLAFILWYPLWTGIAVPIPFMENVYFALERWR